MNGQMHINLTRGIGVLAGIAGVFVNGLAAMLLWGWFVAPIGVMAIGYWHAIGVSLVVGLLARRAQTADANTFAQVWSEAWNRIVHGLFRPALFIAIGWLVHQVMS